MATLVVSTVDENGAAFTASFSGCEALSENGSLLVFPAGGDRPVGGFAAGWWTTFTMEEDE